MKLTALNTFRFVFTIVVLFGLVSASAMWGRDAKPSPSRSKPGPSARPKTPKKTECTTGPVECCQSVVSVGSPTAKKVLNALHIWVNQTDHYDVGLTCGAVDKHNETDCNASLVCCEDNTHEGVINLKCTPAAAD